MAGSDNCFLHMSSVRPSVRLHFSKQIKFKAKTIFATGETVGLAEWIIDDTCLVLSYFRWVYHFVYHSYELQECYSVFYKYQASMKCETTRLITQCLGFNRLDIYTISATHIILNMGM